MGRPVDVAVAQTFPAYSIRFEEIYLPYRVGRRQTGISTIDLKVHLISLNPGDSSPGEGQRIKIEG